VRVLVLATRFPGGRKSGRKAVIRTILRSLVSLGHDVELGVVAKDEKDEDARMPADLAGLTIHRFEPPPLVRIGWNAATRFPLRRMSLNECLYFSPRLKRELGELVAEREYGLAIADTIRLTGVLADTSPPLIVDFDDLLSTRYADLEDAGGSPDALLGFYARSLPRFVVRPAAALAARALRRESSVLREREITVARSADAVSLVGAGEAAELQRRAGVPVACLPMAVAVSDPPAPVGRNPGDRFACLGGMDFQANLTSLRWFAAELLPAIRQRRPGFQLDMIGFCPDDVRAELTRPGLSFSGYVEDLAGELRGYRGFVAPIDSGTGVKTKVLDAMAVGLPVVSTPLGVAGLDVEDGRQCLIAREPGDFAAAVERLSEDPEEAARIGSEARALVLRSFAPEVIAERWREVIASIPDARDHGEVAHAG
jgi:Glycosyl transferases group 1